MSDYTTAKIEADPTVPVIHITRDFRATPTQLVRAHTDPALVAQWMGPDRRTMEPDYWDARSGGSCSAARASPGGCGGWRGSWRARLLPAVP